ncbi:hypothetical protein C0992_009507 [Termitomyces sp. T32_za158]|nr:hypothetical protein C0992_009507 [Termitomyces sp. T32_za158]
MPASRHPQSSPFRRQSTQAFSLNKDTTPFPEPGTSAAQMPDRGLSGHQSDDCPQSLHASGHAASPTPSGKSNDGYSGNVYNILSSLTGAINSLREEWHETRDSLSATSTPTTSSGSRTTSGRSPYKTLSNRRLREQSRIDMMKVVRNALKPLLDIKQDKDISESTKNGQHMASPDEVDDFDNGSIPAPSLTPFRPYWDDIYCSWNESLSEQFTDQILTANRELDDEVRDSVKKHFFQRLETLKRELRRQTPRVHETPAQATQ